MLATLLLLACTATDSADIGEPADSGGETAAPVGERVACVEAELPWEAGSGDRWWWGWLPDGVLVESGSDEDTVVLTDGHTVAARWWREDPGAAGHGWNDGFRGARNGVEDSTRALVLVIEASDSVTDCEITLY